MYFELPGMYGHQSGAQHIATLAGYVSRRLPHVLVFQNAFDETEQEVG